MNDRKLTPVPGAESRYDGDGNEIVDVVTCGTCGRSWNDAAVSGVTPAPSGRCPFEGDHRTTFGSFVAFGDTVTETRDGVTYTVRVEHDATCSIDDDDVHREDPNHPAWEGSPEGIYRRAMEARRAYLRDEWHYGILIVSAERDGWARDYVASLGGVEINYPGTKNEYLDVVAGDLIDEAAAEIAGLIGEPQDPTSGPWTAQGGDGDPFGGMVLAPGRAVAETYTLADAQLIAKMRAAFEQIRDMTADPNILTGPARVLDQLDRCKALARETLPTD